LELELSYAWSKSDNEDLYNPKSWQK
jgi:hypothetical protein